MGRTLNHSMNVRGVLCNCLSWVDTIFRAWEALCFGRLQCAWEEIVQAKSPVGHASCMTIITTLLKCSPNGIVEILSWRKCLWNVFRKKLRDDEHNIPGKQDFQKRQCPAKMMFENSTQTCLLTFRIICMSHSKVSFLSSVSRAGGSEKSTQYEKLKHVFFYCSVSSWLTTDRTRESLMKVSIAVMSEPCMSVPAAHKFLQENLKQSTFHTLLS